MEKIYRHFKGGYYRFITDVTNSETQEKEVVYQDLYGEHKRIHIKMREIVRDKETGRIITTYKK